jgi:hypothetical protein
MDLTDIEIRTPRALHYCICCWQYFCMPCTFSEHLSSEQYAGSRIIERFLIFLCIICAISCRGFSRQPAGTYLIRLASFTRRSIERKAPKLTIRSPRTKLCARFLDGRAGLFITSTIQDSPMRVSGGWKARSGRAICMSHLLRSGSGPKAAPAICFWEYTRNRQVRLRTSRGILARLAQNAS